MRSSVIMALFPHVDFELSFAKTGVRAGERNEGTLTLRVPKGGIERVEHIEFRIACTASLIIGMSTSTRTITHDFGVVSQKIQIPERHRPPHVPKDGALTLPEGEHVFPIVFDLSDAVPAYAKGPDWELETRATVHLSVDWAMDPKAAFRLAVTPKSTTHTQSASAFHSPADFFKDDTFEVSLAKSVVRHGDPITGQITLRANSAEDYVVAIALRNFMRFKMSQGEVNSPEPRTDVRFEKAALMMGKPLSFSLPTTSLNPLALNDAIDITSSLRVQIIRPWIGFHGSFEIPVVVTPKNARITGE
jgi:hypothetical protein